MISDKIILGIDPGTRILGWGVIKVSGNKVYFLEMGVIDLHLCKDHYQKLRAIYNGVNELIHRFKPAEMAVEAPFYGKNIQSMFVLGRAQGAAITAALSTDIQVSEYAPRKVKMAITGRGAASKEQVASLLCNILKIENPSVYLDATDGVAVAYCHFLESARPAVSNGGKSNWKEFVKNNPDRIK